MVGSLTSCSDSDCDLAHSIFTGQASVVHPMKSKLYLTA